MRSTLLSLLSIVALTTNSLAISGGPWDDNSTGNGGNGTYQAILEMKNGSGIARFTEGGNAQVSPFSSSQIFYRGIIYVGTCFAVVDMNKKRVTGMTNGSSSGFQSTSTETEDNSNFFFGLETTNETSISGASSGAGGVVGNCNTSWSGKVTGTAPILEFEAKGEAYFFGDLDTQQSQVVNVTNEAEVNPDILQAFVDIIAAFNGGGDNPGVTIQGVDDLLTIFNTTVANRDSASSTVTSTGGQDHVFPDIGVQVALRVYGHQITFQLVPPIGGSGVSGTDGAGRGTFLF